jgi:hypothetical protein
MAIKKHEIITNKVKGMPKKPVIQEHHITYEPERTVLIYKGEHYILTLLQWRKYISKGMIKALEQFIKDYKHLAVPLKKPKKKTTRRKRGTRRQRATPRTKRKPTRKTKKR